jgi:hypothetical protein
MEQLKISKIKAAGKNIRNTGLLMLASIITFIIAYFHFTNLSYTQFIYWNFTIDLNTKIVTVNMFLLIYGVISSLLLILIITNIIKAGNNLRLCDSNDTDVSNYDDKKETEEK